MLIELWRPVRSNPNYSVSSLGRVCRTTPGKGVKKPGLLKIHRDRGGYCWAALGENAGRIVHGYVATLVAGAFIGPCPPGFEVDHKDGNQENNATRKHKRIHLEKQKAEAER